MRPHIAAECKAGGSGQCDGYDSENYHRECECECHETPNLPLTVEGVKEWHDELNGLARTYVIGLPVVITVLTDGRVIVRPDLSEADDLDDDSGSQPEGLTEEQLLSDIATVRAAIDNGTVEVTR